MKLIKPYTEIITPINCEEILKQIELAARTCYKSEDKIEYSNRIDDISIANDDNHFAKSARILISKLIARGHEAMLEFGGMITVKFVCDRGVSHELVRHRLAAFAQESTRYCNYGNQEHITFIIPSWCNIIEGIYSKLGADLLSTSLADKLWMRSMLTDEDNYNILIKDHKWSPQQARSVLPNSLKTEINLSANIREWRHIFRLRTSNAAHPDMQYLIRPLLKEFQSRIPILFDDINY